MMIMGLNSCAQTHPKTKKILVVYFSYSGNTRIIANQIQKATNGDIFEVIPIKAYPSNYNAVVDQAKKEVNSNYKPDLKTKINNIESYDIIFVGSPCWWYTIAPPISTFLSSYDLSGKTIIPFMTHEGSGLKVDDIKKLCPNSTILEGLAIRGSSVSSAQNDIEKWLHKIKIN